MSLMKHWLPTSNLSFPAVLAAVLLTAGCAGLAPPPDAETAAAPEAGPDSATAGAAPAPPAPVREEEIEYGHFSQDILTRVILAEMAGQRGYDRQALDEYLRLARETGDIGIIRRAARIAAFVRDVPATIEMADLWLAREPHSREAHRTLAFQMLSLGRYRQGLDHLVALLEMGQNVDFRIVTSRTAADPDAELFIDALIADFSTLLERYPDNQSLRLALAHLYQQNNQPREAYGHVSRLSEELNDAPDVVTLEVRLLDLMGEQERAGRRLEQAMRSHPDNKELRFQYARRLISDQDYRGAREQFSRLVEQDPDDYDMLYSLALINMELNTYGEARRHFQTLVNNAQRLDDAHYYLGFIAQQENDLSRAVEHYVQVGAGGNFLQAQRSLTEILVRQGRYGEAKARLERLRYNNPDMNIPLLSMEAGVLLDHEHYQQAGVLLDSSLQAFPDEVQLLYLRAVLKQETDDLEQMEKDLRRIIVLNPESPVAYNTLGYILADRTMRYQEAYDLIRKAIDMAPDDPAIIDSLGWVQYHLGMYEEALRNLDRAFELFPDHEVAAHLGEVLWVMGERRQANKIWQDALKLQPDSEPIKDAIRRLTGESSL